MAIHVFESEAAAQALIAQVGSGPPGGASPESVEVGKVMAHS
jgi:hypothetical protein